MKTEKDGNSLHVWLPMDIWEKIKEYSDENKISMSTIGRLLIIKEVAQGQDINLVLKKAS